MPRINSGVMVLPASDVNPPIAGQVIDPVAYAAEMADIANEITNSLDRIGRGPMLAALQMAGFRITNVGAPIAQTDAARLLDFGTYLPAGALQFFAMQTAPSGWLICDGTAYSRATYTALFAAIGTLYGVGDGSTTFNVPDARGSFPRVWDNGKGLDPSRVFGSYQADMFASHTHSQNPHTHTNAPHSHTTFASSASINVTGAVTSVPQYAPGTPTSSVSVVIDPATATENTAGGAETAPKNLAFQLCIRT